METIYLLSAVSPEHISSRISGLRTQIFKEFGMTSALIFPALIPLTFLSAPPKKNLFEKTSKKVKTFKPVSFREYGGTFILTLSCPSFFKGITDIADNTELTKEDPLGLIGENGEFGFYIAGGKDIKYNYDKNKVITFCRRYKELTMLKWERISLMLLKIEYLNAKKWDEHADWTVLWEK